MKKYIVLLIVALLFLPSEALAAPPTAQAQADSVKVFKKLDRKYQRQKDERKKVASLIRDLLEVQKFQFDAYARSYKGTHEESFITVRGYGRDIWMYDARTYNRMIAPPTFYARPSDEFLERNRNRGYKTRDRGDSWSFSVADYSLTNVREEGDFLLFDIIVNAPVRTPENRSCYQSKMEFYSDIYSGMIVMRVLFMNKDDEVIEQGPTYSGFLNVLR